MTTGTNHRNTPRQSTINALLKRKQDCTWRTVAYYLGYEDTTAAAAMLCGVAKGRASSISKESEKDLRQRLGINAQRKRYMTLRLPVEWRGILGYGEARCVLEKYLVENGRAVIGSDWKLVVPSNITVKTLSPYVPGGWIFATEP